MGGKSEYKDTGLNREINSKLEFTRKNVYTVLHAIGTPYMLTIGKEITRI